MSREGELRTLPVIEALSHSNQGCLLAFEGAFATITSNAFDCSRTATTSPGLQV